MKKLFHWILMLFNKIYLHVFAKINTSVTESLPRQKMYDRSGLMEEVRYEDYLSNGVKNIEYQINVQDYIGCTSLNHAIDKNNLKEVKQLIQNGAQINQQDYMGYTPLHYAIVKSSLKIIEYLIQNGAYLSLQNKISDFLLNRAVKGGFIEELVKCLIDGGVVYGKFWQTMPEYWLKQPEVAKILLEVKTESELLRSLHFSHGKNKFNVWNDNVEQQNECLLIKAINSNYINIILSKHRIFYFGDIILRQVEKGKQILNSFAESATKFAFFYKNEMTLPLNFYCWINILSFLEVKDLKNFKNCLPIFFKHHAINNNYVETLKISPFNPS